MQNGLSLMFSIFYICVFFRPGGIVFLKKSKIAVVVGLAMSSFAHAASTVDMVVAIDESGSMSSWQGFVGSYVNNLDTVLTSQGVTTNQFGLVGFGGASYTSTAANEAGRETGSALYRSFNLVSPTSGLFGGAANFSAVSGSQLVVNGGTEDGYRAIDYLLRNYTFRSSAGASVFLVTDEDRDNDTGNLPTGSALPTDGVLAKTHVQNELATKKIVLHSVSNQRLFDKDGNAAIAVVGATPATGTAYVKKSDGSVVAVTGGYSIGYASGTTVGDYAELALASGGTVMDISEINSIINLGGAALSNLSAAMAQLVAQISQNQQPVIGIDCASATGVARTVCDSMSRSTNTPVQNFLNQVIAQTGGVPARINPAFARLTPQQFSAATRAAFFSFRSLSRNLFQRLADIRAAGGFGRLTDVNAASFGEFSYAGHAGGAAGGDDSGLGYFVRGNYTRGDMKTSGTSFGFNSDTYQIAAGVDKFITPGLQLGVSFGYANSDSDMKEVAGGSKNENYTLSMYGSYEVMPNLYLEGVAGYGMGRYSVSRDTGVSGIAYGKTNGRQFILSGGLNGNVDLADLTLKPYGRINYVRLDIDGFSESGAGAANLDVAGHAADSVVSDLGAVLQKRLDSGWTLEGKLGWEHEIKRANGTTKAALSADPSVAMNFVGSGGSRDYGRVGLGVTKDLGQARTIALRGEAMVGHSQYSEHMVELKFRQEF